MRDDKTISMESWDELKTDFLTALENVKFVLESISIVMPPKRRFCIIAMGEDSFNWIEGAFFDKAHNLHRWLAKQPCVFCNDLENVMMEVEIAQDEEALYRFLEFCRRQNLNVEVDSEYLDYMEHLISLAKPC